jgi:hypothetical protein
VSLEIQGYIGAATRPEPAADAGPRIENGTPAPEKKEDSRKAASNRLATETGTRHQSEASIPEKEKTDCNGTSKDRVRLVRGSDSVGH